MKRTTQRWKFTFVLIGVVGCGLAFEAVVMAAFSILEYQGPPPGLHRMLLLQLGVFGLSLVVTGICCYRIAARTEDKLWASLSRLLETGSTEAEACVFAEGKPSGGTPFDAILHLMELQTDRHRRTLRELVRANNFLKSMIRHNAVAISIVDLKGRVKMVNPAFEELYGFGLEEIQETPDKIVPERLREEPKQLIERVKNGLGVKGYETRRITADGKEIHVSLTISPILNEMGELEAFAAISRNITERKMTEERLRRSEKLSVVGQLAAGVAHEIRNPLTTLRGFVQLMKQRHSGNPEHLELMLKELDRINFIVSEFIVLAKPHLNQYAFKDLGLMLNDLAILMEPEAYLNGIVLDTRLEPGLPKIRCEENQLKQVILNIVKNGMEAMPDGGVVTLEVRRIEQGRVLIRVTDRGVGIPDELLEKLGEPFVTSKEQGTGLGIMVSQQIIANHKGQMVIRSERGRGTCVDVVLPVDFENMKPEGAPGSFPLVIAEKPA